MHYFQETSVYTSIRANMSETAPLTRECSYKGTLLSYKHGASKENAALWIRVNRTMRFLLSTCDCDFIHMLFLYMLYVAPHCATLRRVVPLCAVLVAKVWIRFITFIIGHSFIRAWISTRKQVFHEDFTSLDAIHYNKINASNISVSNICSISDYYCLS